MLPAARQLTLALCLLISMACWSSCITGTSSTPTPPYGLPVLNLPKDESPHDFQTEWWYFNAHLLTETDVPIALHDVVFQVQPVSSSRTIYVRQIGLATPASGDYATSERIRTSTRPIEPSSGNFRIPIGEWVMQGTAGLDYKLSAGAGGYSYDLTMTASAPPLIHDTDGLVDFAAAGVTYYYSRPRLDVVGTLRGPNGHSLRVTGLAWLDKQWGDFQPSAVEWNWASIQLDDGTDVMVTTLYDDKGALVDTYATFRRLGGEVKRLDGVDFTFTSLDATWHSQRSDTTYHTEWRVKIPSEGIDLVLQPSMVQSEFSSQVLGVVYWESAVSVVDRHGRAVGQGFVELNRMLGSVP